MNFPYLTWWYLRHVAMTAMIFAAWLDLSEAARLWTGRNQLSTGRQSQSTVEVDSATPITLPVIVRSKVFSQALELLSSMQSAPSCNRVATTKLLTACKSIEGPSPTVESTLDDIRSLYAAQLAVCELQDAGSQMPPHCSFNLLPESSRSAEDYGELDANQLRQCLVSLESRPQWWTSYSNNKQNAVVLCQATRVEIEKDDIIKLYKSMASTTSNLEAALVETVQQASRQIAQQRRLATIIESVQQKALHDLEASNTQARSYLSHMKQAFTSAMEAVRVKVSSIMLEVEDDMLGLSKSLKESNIDATDLEKNIGRIFEQVVQSSSGLAATQAQQWDTNLVIAAKLQNSLEMMRGHEMDALLSTFGSLHDQLETTNTLMTKMYLRQKVLDDKLSTLDTSFEKLATKAIAFQALQTRQADTQGRIYDQMHTSMQLTSARLAAIDASALDVSTKIRNLTSMMSQLASLMGAFGTVMKWKWLVLVVLGVARFNSRTAVSIAGIIALFYLSFDLWAHFSTEAVLVHYASGYEISVPTLFRIIGILISVPIILLATRSVYCRSLLEKSKSWHSLQLTSIFTFWARSRRWRPATGIVLHSED